MPEIVIRIQCEKTGGKFVSKDELADAIIESIDTTLYVDESQYEITDINAE